MAAAVLVACSSGDPADAPSDAGGTGTLPAAGATTTSTGGSPSTSGSAPGPAGDGGGDPSPNTTAGGTSGTSAPAPAAELPAPGPVGAYAPVYLRPDASTRLVLEIRSQDGAAPTRSSIEHVQQTLAAVSGKEVVLSGGTIAGGARAWSSADIRAAADGSEVAQSPQGAVMRLLFLRGGFAESDTALGVAVRSDVAAVFADRLDEATGLVGGRDRLERAVSLHEAGHLLGLVDLFLDTGRADPEHPGHSPNRGSVMYYAVESTLVGTLLEGGPPTDFDDQDRADLAAIRRGG